MASLDYIIYSDWEIKQMNTKLSEKFIEKNKHKVYWNLIFKYQSLSEEFIEKHFNSVCFNYQCIISKHQKLSERFIEKYFNILSWDVKYTICEYQKLSTRFLLLFYKNEDTDFYNLLKEKNDEFREYAKLIEEQIPLILIEF